MPNEVAGYRGSSKNGQLSFVIDLLLTVQARYDSLCAPAVQCCLHESNALCKAMLLPLSMLHACDGVAISIARPTHHICNNSDDCSHSDGYNNNATCLTGQVSCSFASVAAHLSSIQELGRAVQGELDVCMLDFVLIQWTAVVGGLAQVLLA